MGWVKRMINLLGESNVFYTLKYECGTTVCAHDVYTLKPSLFLNNNHISRNNNIIFSYGLPKLSNVPNGYSALAEIYGKGANRSPLLVAFGFPLDWVVTLPSQDVNGEDGTIQAGEYAKGDTATFYVVPNQSKVEVRVSFELDAFDLQYLFTHVLIHLIIQ